MSDEDGGILVPRQRTISAASAAPVATTAARSAFDLAGAAPAQAPQGQSEQQGKLSLLEHCLKCVESCGALDADQLAQATGVPRKAAAKAADYLASGRGGGRLLRATGDDGRRVYRLPDAPGAPPKPSRGLKKFLSRRADVMGPTAHAPAPAAAGQAVEESLVCGVLNTGELLIQLPYVNARIKLMHWMELRDYLNTLQPHRPAK